MAYVVTWKGCSNGRWRKYVDVVVNMPSDIDLEDIENDVDQFEEYLASYAGVSETNALSFTSWLKENMPHFLFDYSNGDNPRNFKVLKIEKTRCPHCPRKGIPRTTVLVKRTFGYYKTGRLHATFDCPNCGREWIKNADGNWQNAGSLDKETWSPDGKKRLTQTFS